MRNIFVGRVFVSREEFDREMQLYDPLICYHEKTDLKKKIIAKYRCVHGKPKCRWNKSKPEKYEQFGCPARVVLIQGFIVQCVELKHNHPTESTMALLSDKTSKFQPSKRAPVQKRKRQQSAEEQKEPEMFSLSHHDILPTTPTNFQDFLFPPVLSLNDDFAFPLAKNFNDFDAFGRLTPTSFEVSEHSSDCDRQLSSSTISSSPFSSDFESPSRSVSADDFLAFDHDSQVDQVTPMDAGLVMPPIPSFDSAIPAAEEHLESSNDLSTFFYEFFSTLPASSVNGSDPLNAESAEHTHKRARHSLNDEPASEMLSLFSPLQTAFHVETDEDLMAKDVSMGGSERLVNDSRHYARDVHVPSVPPTSGLLFSKASICVLARHFAEHRVPGALDSSAAYIATVRTFLHQNGIRSMEDLVFAASAYLRKHRLKDPATSACFVPRMCMPLISA